MTWTFLTRAIVVGFCLVNAKANLYDDEYYEVTECFDSATFLTIDCSSSSTVVEILFNLTYFGNSTCDKLGECCPTPDDCIVTLLDSPHYEEYHWDQLESCNGLPRCSIQVVRVGAGYGCDPNTDYETVAFECVPQYTFPPSSTKSSTGNNTTTNPAGTGSTPLSNDTAVAVAIGVTFSLLFVIMLGVILCICCRSQDDNKASGAVSFSEVDLEGTRKQGTGSCSTTLSSRSTTLTSQGSVNVTPTPTSSATPSVHIPTTKSNQARGSSSQNGQVPGKPPPTPSTPQTIAINRQGNPGTPIGTSSTSDQNVAGQHQGIDNEGFLLIDWSEVV